jgi:hypothetical protein
VDIYKVIAKDLREVNADGMEAHLAFVALGISGIRYLKYIEMLRERRKEEEDRTLPTRLQKVMAI